MFLNISLQRNRKYKLYYVDRGVYDIAYTNDTIGNLRVRPDVQL